MKSLNSRIIPAILATSLLFLGSMSGSATPEKPLLSLPDSTFTVDSSEFTIVFFVGHLNTDPLKDTLVGLSYYNDVSLPKYILWGKTDSVSGGSTDTATGEPNFDTLKVDTTELLYPPWNNLEGTVSLLNLNSDTLTDLMFVIRGISDTGLLAQDTACFLGIFGQRGLDTFDVLDLEIVDSLQSMPFFSLLMLPDTNYTDPLVREVTGRISYIIEPIDLDVHRSDPAGEPAKPVAGELPYREHSVAFYPNPASRSINIETIGLPPGEYRIEIYSSSGDIVLSRPFPLDKPGETRREIQLRELASGAYLMRLSGSQGLVGSYWLVVVR